MDRIATKREFDRNPHVAALWTHRGPDEESEGREGREDRHPEVRNLLRTWHPQLRDDIIAGRAVHAR